MADFTTYCCEKERMMTGLGNERFSPPRGMRRWAIGALLGGGVVVAALLVVIVVLLVSGGGDGQDAKPHAHAKASSTASQSAKTPTFTVEGNVTLANVEIEGLGGGQCQGGNGYEDLTQGAQVVITDATNKTVALGALDAGTHSGPHAPLICIFHFLVSDVPSGAGPYSVQVSHRGETAFNEADASGLSIILGD